MPSVMQHVPGYATGSTITMAVPSAPVAATDTAYVVVVSGRAGLPRNINSITGLGATWAATNHDAVNAGRMRVWKGTSPSASGNVVVSLSGSQPSSAAVYIVRDLNNSSVVQATSRTFAAGSTTHFGPRMFAGPNQVVLAVAIGDAAITLPSASDPATGWTTATHNSVAGYGFRVPVSTMQENGLSFTQAASTTGVTCIGEVVVGDGGDYASLVAQMLPFASWRFDEPSGVGTAFLDHGKGGLTLAIGGTPSYRITGALVNDPDTGVGTARGDHSADPDAYRTISGWFKYASAPGTSVNVASCWFNGNGITYAGVDMGTDGKLTITPGPATSALSYADNAWHMITWTYNNTDTKSRLYVDGVLVLTGPAIVFPTSQNRFAIGNGSTAMDEALILNSTLSDTEVADLYVLGTTGPPTSSSPLWWDGDSLESAELLGWWDGDSVEPVELLGQWDGTAIAPIEPPS